MGVIGYEGAGEALGILLGLLDFVGVSGGGISF